ncbi:hypothetical protein JYK14_19775 [Siccirubricoccus sp. KC 17139]|uniref:MFS transporter n=1 Tax=Siccirubricoccus soli TaxID=2899147 RepID=A0ABT1D8W5_9PROT|nr:hypothetical protein [Siccirubricoccus soli]MCO6418385.1 hypothetical protein [Siccirubricoccus soli]MCP2684520.1 hypothetical protein [Siccirubricoccus soli]
MSVAPRWRVPLALLATTVLNLPLGTVYAFSVFLRPMEAELALSRAELSFVFGATLVCYTLAMNLAPLAYRLAPAPVLIAAGGLLAGLGTALASQATGLAALLIGYAGGFGIGGGIAYVLFLQGVNLMLTRRQGLVNGFMVSLYPLGAMLGAPLLGWALAGIGLRPTLLGLAAVLALAGLAAALLAALAGLSLVAPPASTRGAGAPRLGLFLRLWGVFFLAAASGLTVIGQAAGIVRAYGGSAALGLLAATFITGCIAAARLGGGVLADRFTAPAVMAGAHALALLADILLLAFPGPAVAVASLAGIGIGYGLVSGSSAAAISAYWGAARYGQIAARLYIAWCVAAVTLPVIAGRVFDLSGGYAAAIALAMLGNALGLGVALSLPRRQAKALA